jgi:hypothetical protein
MGLRYKDHRLLPEGSVADTNDAGKGRLPQRPSDIGDRGSFMKICVFSALAHLLFVSVFGFTTLSCTNHAAAQSFLENTHLIDVHMGSRRSDEVSLFRTGGYELADGTAVRFDPWYRSNWRDMSVSFLTEAAPNWGLIWGPSTGEKGEKYQIDPALEVGLIFQVPLSGSASMAISASTKFGGVLQEQTCTADYGDIGGTQQVNCRLAAGTLAPADTLDYLIRLDAREESRVSLSYELLF